MKTAAPLKKGARLSKLSEKLDRFDAEGGGEWVSAPPCPADGLLHGDLGNGRIDLLAVIEHHPNALRQDQTPCPPAHRHPNRIERPRLWRHLRRSEERRVGKEWSVRVDIGGRRCINKNTRTRH